MKKRLISAAILLVILVPLVIIGKWPFALAVGVVGILTFKEITDLGKYPLIVKLMCFIGLIGLVYSGFSEVELDLGLNRNAITASLMLMLLPTLFLQSNDKYNTSDAFKLFGFAFLCGLGLNHFILIRSLGLNYFFLMALIPIITDTFAYIGGSLIGKNKMSKLSPKKTWEGALIGSLMSTFIMTLYYVSFIRDPKNIFLTITVIFTLTIAGQVGDLFFSAIKRQEGVKDFSNLIPGHGGILDRLDSLLFVAIFFAVFKMWL